jgi:hypothetical protein
MTTRINLEKQTQKLEQLSDLDWAMKTLDGKGEPGDSPQLAEWMLKKLVTTGVNESIRHAAKERLEELRAAA